MGHEWFIASYLWLPLKAWPVIVVLLVACLAMVGCIAAQRMKILMVMHVSAPKETPKK